MSKQATPMTSVTLVTEKIQADWLTDDQGVGEHQTGHRPLHMRQSFCQTQDFSIQCRQSERSNSLLVEKLPLGQLAYWLPPTFKSTGAFTPRYSHKVQM